MTNVSLVFLEEDLYFFEIGLEGYVTTRRVVRALKGLGQIAQSAKPPTRTAPGLTLNQHITYINTHYKLRKRFITCED